MVRKFEMINIKKMNETKKRVTYNFFCKNLQSNIADLHDGAIPFLSLIHIGFGFKTH